MRDVMKIVKWLIIAAVIVLVGPFFAVLIFGAFGLGGMMAFFH